MKKGFLVSKHTKLKDFPNCCCTVFHYRNLLKVETNITCWALFISFVTTFLHSISEKENILCNVNRYSWKNTLFFLGEISLVTSKQSWMGSFLQDFFWNSKREKGICDILWICLREISPYLPFSPQGILITILEK